MPAYNFKARFASMVESGRKRQTIRVKRERATRPGDVLYLYAGMRTKACRKLGQHVCIEVVSINLYVDRIIVNGRELGWEQVHNLVIDDGFVDVGEFYDFFRSAYGIPVVDTLEIIKW